MRCDLINILVCIEDPGALNFIKPIIQPLLNNYNEIIIAVSELVEHNVKDISVSKKIKIDKNTNPYSLPVEKIDLIITGTSENRSAFGLKLHEYAKQKNILSVSMVDGPANAAYRFRGNSFHPTTYAPDFILLADKETKKKYLKVGFKKNILKVVGHPHYDTLKKARKSFEEKGKFFYKKKYFPKLALDKKILIFLSELSTGLNPNEFYYSDDYTFLGRGIKKDRTSIILEELLNVVNDIDDRPYFVIRLHPKEQKSFFTDYLSEIDCMSELGNPLEIVYASDLVVGMSSMLVMESALLGKPTISVLPRYKEKDWLYSIKLGLTPSIHNKKNLKSSISKILKNPKSICADFKSFGIPLNSTSNILILIQNLLKNKRS